MTGLPSMYQIILPWPPACSFWSHANSKRTGRPCCMPGTKDPTTRCFQLSSGVKKPQCRHEWLIPSPFHVSAMSISPSVGHAKGSYGRSQNAGQMPAALGRVRVATRLPRGRASRWRDTSRAEVYFRAGSGWEGLEMARRTRRLLPVL